MKLLLHVCCAPCAVYPVFKAKQDGFVTSGFFYNPNIHPAAEYAKRKEAAERYFGSEGLEVFYPGYDAGEFFYAINTLRPADERCSTCWELRMNKAASFAGENDFDAFTTTLLGSPYQDHMAIKEICEKLATANGIDFYYNDFREGFKEAHTFARNNAIYCQNYCGCVFSMVEREENKEEKRIRVSKI